MMLVIVSGKNVPLKTYDVKVSREDSSRYTFDKVLYFDAVWGDDREAA